MIKYLTSRARRFCSPVALNIEVGTLKELFVNNGYPFRILRQTPDLLGGWTSMSVFLCGCLGLVIQVSDSAGRLRILFVEVLLEQGFGCISQPI